MFFITRARKKKCLTDLVDLIPFPNQNLRDKISSVPKPIAPPVRQASIPVEPEKKLTTVSSADLNTTSLSIKKMMEKKEDDKSGSEQLHENLPRNPFTFDQVKRHWRSFAFEMKEQGKETFYNAMIKREPIQKEETHFVMDVDNQTQVDMITPHLLDLVGYFRKELKNYSIDISFKLNDNPEHEVKFLTGKDKFAAMARKNPNLHTLKSTFNLDIEF